MSKSIHYFYIVVPNDWKYMKIGRWSSTILSLKARYATYYGSCEMYVFQCEDSIFTEKQAFKKLAAFHWQGELYDRKGLETILQFCQSVCCSFVAARDLLIRLNNERVEKAKRAEIEAVRQQKENQKKDFLSVVDALCIQNEPSHTQSPGKVIEFQSSESKTLSDTVSDDRFLDLKRQEMELKKREAELRIRKRMQNIQKLEEMEKAHQQNLQQQLKETRENPSAIQLLRRFLDSNSQIKVVKGAKTECRDFRALYQQFIGVDDNSKSCVDLELLKQINPSWTMKKLHICKSCGKSHKAKCCPEYDRLHRSSANFILNMQID